MTPGYFVEGGCCMALDPSMPGLVLFGGYGEELMGNAGFCGLIKLSTDHGTTWQVSLSASGARIVALERDPWVPGRFVACRDPVSNPDITMLQSFDYGVSWESMPGCSLYISGNADLAFSLCVPDRMLCAHSGGIYLRQGGMPWERVLEADARALETDPVRPGHIYAACGTDGVYRSTDDGATWVSMGELIPGEAVNALEVELVALDWLYAGAFSYGAFRYDLEPSSVPGGPGPAGCSIRASSNPSRGGVLLEVVTTGAEPALEVFDLAGRLVRRVSLGSIPGQASIVLDALVPGIYSAVLGSGGASCSFVVVE